MKLKEINGCTYAEHSEVSDMYAFATHQCHCCCSCHHRPNHYESHYLTEKRKEKKKRNQLIIRRHDDTCTSIHPSLFSETDSGLSETKWPQS